MVPGHLVSGIVHKHDVIPLADSKGVITIGIIGKDPFGDAFGPIEGRQVKNRTVVVKRFKDFKELIGSAGWTS